MESLLCLSLEGHREIPTTDPQLQPDPERPATLGAGYLTAVVAFSEKMQPLQRKEGVTLRLPLSSPQIPTSAPC